MKPAPASTVDDLQSLTERYARYSRSAGGLSNVIGAVLVVAAFAIAAFVPLTPALRIALAATPFLWLATKETMRQAYYQRAGGALQQVSPTLRRQRRWMVGYLLAVSAFVVGGVFWMGGTGALRGPILGYLVLVAFLPFAAWRWFWSIGDFFLGVLLFCQAAVVFAGGRYDGLWLVFVIGCAGFAALVGLREHCDYLQLRSALGLDGDPR